MEVGCIEGVTRICGKEQGYLGLPLRDEAFACPVNGAVLNAMITAWIPSPGELAALNAGAAVHGARRGRRRFRRRRTRSIW